MQRMNRTTLVSILVGVFVLAVTVILWPTGQASAQCGSQASSCKNCHEVQSNDPVNNDGTGWHQSHAFGDFCYLCHAGNSQSLDKAEAHIGMVPPLSDVEAGCQSCHPNDLTEKAGVYAAALGVEVGAGGDLPAPPDDPGSVNEPEPQAEEPQASAPQALVLDDGNLVDYEAQYSETVLGQKPVNMGNWIVVGMIGLIGLGGGAFVYRNERKLRKSLTKDPWGPLAPRVTEGPTTVDRGPLGPLPKGDRTAVNAYQIEGDNLPDDVARLLPKILLLNPVGLHGLDRLLENPDEANQLLHNLSRLDPDLIRQLRNLDRDARALLLAMAGN